MTLTVRLFAKLRDLAGADAVTLALPAGATVADIRRALADRHPAMAGLLARSAVALDHDIATDTAVVAPGAEVAVLPPVSGDDAVTRNAKWAVGCGLPVAAGLWAMTTLAGLFWVNLPSNRLAHRWDQPADVSYGSFEPYTVYVLEGTRRWTHLGPDGRRYDVWVAPKTDAFPNHGHLCEYGFHYSITDPEKYLRTCVAVWTPDGVTLTEPTGHRLFVPKSAFVGGR